MSNPLDGPRAKIARAREHLDTLKRETAPFRGRLKYGEQYSIFPEFDLQTRKFHLRLHVMREPDLLRFGILVGDVVHQARSALDHLIEQATIVHNGSALPGTEFPVFTDPAAYAQRHTKGSRKGDPTPTSGLHAIRGIDPRLFDLVEKLQPYNRAAPGSIRSLGVLHGFWNMDKHRIPAVVATSTLASYPKLNLRGAPGGQRDWYIMMKFPLGENVNLVEGTLLPDETPQEIQRGVKMQLASEIEFGDGPLDPQRVSANYMVVETLETAIKFATAVIDDFAKFIP